jgi:hypothetical protein
MFARQFVRILLSPLILVIIKACTIFTFTDLLLYNVVLAHVLFFVGSSCCPVRLSIVLFITIFDVHCLTSVCVVFLICLGIFVPTQ